MTITVLHVLEAVEGGTARHVVDLVSSVGEVQHEVALPRRRAVGVTDVAAAGAIEAAGGRVHFVEMDRRPQSLRNAKALLAIRRLVEELNPTIVHGHSSVGGALARLAVWRRPAGLVYTPNAIAPGRSARAIERVLSRRTDRFIAVSASEGEQALQLGIVTLDKLRVVPNGIHLDAPPPLDPSLRSRLGLSTTTPLVGSVGRLAAQKAPEVFVATCELVSRHCPEAHFVLIGSGPLERSTSRAVDRAGLGGRFHQLLSLEHAARALGELDVYVSTARFEGGPYAPLEAMRARTPVVLTDAVGNRDLIVPGVSGMLVPRDDPAATATAIVGLLADTGLRRGFADAAASRLIEYFGVPEMGRAAAAVYAELAHPPH